MVTWLVLGISGRSIPLQALRILPALQGLSDENSVPCISSFVMASSGSVGWSSSPAVSRCLLGASGESDGPLFGRKLEDSALIVDLVLLCVAAIAMGCCKGRGVDKDFDLFDEGLL